jgi:hypothetical protein
LKRTTAMQSEVFRENAQNCAILAKAASNEPTFLRYKRMGQLGSRRLVSRIGWMEKIGPIQMHAMPQMSSGSGAG